MSVFEKLSGKKADVGLLCGNCSHSIVQDPDSGKWYHTSRDTSDACYVFDSKTTLQCKCLKATPFKNNVPSSSPMVESVKEPGKKLGLEHTTLPEPAPVPEPEPEPPNPVKDILAYLGEYELAHSVLILEVCKKIILEKIKVEKE